MESDQTAGNFFALKTPQLPCILGAEVNCFMKLKAILCRMLSMCPESWYIFRRGLQLSAFLMLCAFALLLEWDGHMLERYTLYMTAVSLMETTQAILLVSVLASVLIEDAQS